MQVQSLGWKDPLEEGMATHSSILAWRISWTEEPAGLRSLESQRLTQLKQLRMHLFSRTGEITTGWIWGPTGPTVRWT